MSRAITLFTVVSVLALVVAGCGGTKKSSSSSNSTSTQEVTSATGTGGSDPVAQDATVEAAVRDFLTEVETCYVDQMNYSNCKQPSSTKADIESGSGQV